jgi:hypothetical protein
VDHPATAAALRAAPAPVELATAPPAAYVPSPPSSFLH